MDEQIATGVGAPAEVVQAVPVPEADKYRASAKVPFYGDAKGAMAHFGRPMAGDPKPRPDEGEDEDEGEEDEDGA